MKNALFFIWFTCLYLFINADGVVYARYGTQSTDSAD